MGTVNYIDAASIAGYVDGFNTMPDSSNYETLSWAGTPIAKSVLEISYLNLIKSRKLKELQDAMGAELLLGFPSDALVNGVERQYNSDLQNQIAIIGAVVYCTPAPSFYTTPISFTLPSIDLTTGVLDFHPHTLPQLHHLLEELGTWSSGKIQKLVDLSQIVMTTNTGNISADLDTIAAIVW